MLTRFGSGGWLGLLYHAHGPNWVEPAQPWREDLVGIASNGASSGVLASGPIISLMDNTTSMSVRTLRRSFQRGLMPGKTMIGRNKPIGTALMNILLSPVIEPAE